MGEEEIKPVEEVKPLDKVERAEAAVKRIEETEARLDEKIAKLEDLKSEAVLSGETGGHVEAKPKPEISDEDYAAKAMAGEVPNGEK